VKLDDIYNAYWEHILGKIWSSTTIIELKAEPVEKWPKEGDECFMPTIPASGPCGSKITWNDNPRDRSAMEHGFVYRTQEEAEACAEAMLEAARKFKEGQR